MKDLGDDLAATIDVNECRQSGEVLGLIGAPHARQNGRGVKKFDRTFGRTGSTRSGL